MPATVRNKGFLDPATVPATRLLEEHFELFAAELAQCGDDLFAPYPEPDAFVGEWRLLGAYHCKADHLWRPHLVEVERRGLLARTREIVQRIPGIVSAGFSWLGPQTMIYPHSDEQIVRTVRVHMGMRVDSGCVLTVEGESKTWELGRCFVFDPSCTHTAKHTGAAPRVSMLVDVRIEHAHDAVLPAPT